MPSNKRMSNPLALAVLVHLYEQPRHPYELAATLRERRKEQSIKLNYGSLYTVIAALEKNSYIRAVETKREGKRPEKTVYEITNAGEVLMFEWMRELVRVPVKEYPQFEAALSLLPVLPPEEVITLLESRIQVLKEIIKSFDEVHKELRALKLPRLFSIEGEYYEEMTKTERQFAEALLRDIKHDAGGMTTTWKQIRDSVLGVRKLTGNRGLKKGKVIRKKRI